MYTTYTGDRLRLRPYRDADEMIGSLSRLRSLESSTWGPVPLTEAAERRHFESHSRMPFPGSGVFAVETLDGELAGPVSYKVHRRGIRAGVGTVIEENHRKRRLGVEARLLCLCFIFENLPVGKVEAIQCLQSRQRRYVTYLRIGEAEVSQPLQFRQRQYVPYLRAVEVERPEPLQSCQL